ncbi:MAG: Bicarbonate transport ATP-binding protein CmpD [Pseudomonadota bacterium]|jgi:nitrate/nitrite transport system ATP-binding protein
MNHKYLEIHQLGKSFDTPLGPTHVVEGFDLTLREGEFVSIIGHSGCGKSTVLSMVAGLTESSEGAIILAGKEVVDAGPDRGVVFQAPCLLAWLSALENVRLGVDQVYPKKSRAERTEIASHHLRQVGLGDSLHRRPAELSLGMRQRVGLARAFALSPRMLLLDEPFGMLDSLTRIELQDVLLELWAQDQKTAIMITHDVDEAVFLSDRVVMMTSGPHAHVGEILQVPFARPRDRHQLMDSPEFYELRERLVGFLESQGHDAPPPRVSAPKPRRSSLWDLIISRSPG